MPPRGIESHAGEAGVRMDAADDGRMQTSVGRNVVDVVPAACEQSGILAAADDGANILAAHQDAKIFPGGHTVLPLRARMRASTVPRDAGTQEGAVPPMNHSSGAGRGRGRRDPRPAPEEWF